MDLLENDLVQHYIAGHTGVVVEDDLVIDMALVAGSSVSDLDMVAGVPYTMLKQLLVVVESAMDRGQESVEGKQMSDCDLVDTGVVHVAALRMTILVAVHRRLDTALLKQFLVDEQSWEI